MKRVEADFLVRVTASRDSVLQEREALQEIARLGIGPSSDAAFIFEEFARRFSVASTGKSRDGIPRTISRMKTGRGNAHELAFVLLNLFTWSGIDAELVQVWSNREARGGHHELGKLEHVLVYVPDRDRYFDPTSRMSAQLTETGMAPWLEEQPRTYSRYPSDNTGRGYYGKRYSHYTHAQQVAASRRPAS
jgi:hypothetical protein